jgi:hypothetical protein
MKGQIGENASKETVTDTVRRAMPVVVRSLSAILAMNGQYIYTAETFRAQYQKEPISSHLPPPR